jgi:GTP cyclohydrolase II
MGLKCLIQTNLPTSFGDFRAFAFAKDENEKMPLIALTSQFQNFGENPILVRIHSECMTGDVFSSKRCDCGDQLHASMKQIAEEGGVLLYLRQEGRGIGLINKLKAYELQDLGMDTAEANVHLGFEIDERTYETALEVLTYLGIKKVKLLTNNPEKIEIFENSGIELIERVPLVIPPNAQNKEYYRTKQDVMGHLFDL